MSRHNHILVVPFLTDEPLFAYGVEFGMLYARMSDPATDLIEDYFTLWLQEQITLTASRLGWKIIEMRPYDEFWFWCRMERGVS